MRTISRILAPLALLLAMLLPVGGATAAATVVQQGADVTHSDTFYFEDNTCNGEFVFLEGKYTAVFKWQKDGGYIVHVTFHAKGVGSQGNEYVLNYNAKERTETLEYNLEIRTVLVSKGSAPNEWVLIRYHFDGTNGWSTVETTDCRG